MKRLKITLESDLRNAVKACGLSVTELAHRADAPQAALCRFVNGQRGISLKTAAKVAAVLELELKPIGKKKGK